MKEWCAGGLKAACYLRVSTDKQDAENQRADLVQICEARQWEPVWFIDQGLSGKTTERPAYQEVLTAAHQGKVRAVVVWKLDRLGRSTGQLVQDVDNLGRQGCALVSHQDRDIDTTTAGGKLVLAVMAVLAEIEREAISSRTKAAYRAKAARAANLGQKVRWGRKSAKVPGEIVAAVAAGDVSMRAGAAEAGVGVATMHRAVAAFRNGGADFGGDSDPETADVPQSDDSGTFQGRAAIAGGSSTASDTDDRAAAAGQDENARGSA